MDITEDEINCFVNRFFKWNIGNKFGYIITDKNFICQICTLNLRSEQKRMLTRVFTGYQRRTKITRQWARLHLKVPIEKTIRQSLGNESIEKNL